MEHFSLTFRPYQTYAGLNIVKFISAAAIKCYVILYGVPNQLSGPLHTSVLYVLCYNTAVSFGANLLVKTFNIWKIFNAVLLVGRW